MKRSVSKFLYIFLVCATITTTIRCDKDDSSNNEPENDPCAARVSNYYGFCIINSPKNWACVSSGPVILSWLATMQGPTYEVYLGTHIDSIKPISLLTADTLVLRDLESLTTYYWKYTAIDPCGRGCSSGISRFTIVSDLKLPYIETLPVSGGQKLPVSLGGTILYKGKMPITESGIYFGNFPSPEVTGSKISLGCDSGFFSCTLDSLIEDVIYCYKAFATNSFGTFYGKEFQFRTEASVYPDSVTDIEGNHYGTVRIGDQIWMSENLKTTKLNDGELIPSVADNNLWCDFNILKVKLSWLNNDSSYSKTYGAIYNGFVVNSGKICPKGWHVPSDDEWKTLELYLGMPSYDASKIDMRGTYEGLKLKSSNGWLGIGNGFNTSGFKGLPGGYRHALGSFPNPGEIGQWWTSTKDQKYDYLWSRSLLYNASGISRTNISMQFGCSIRCLKD
ncbi:MAG TPA: fibrobacter succinogenes major paralogous domain-containing protein [Bacteroidales bacterium]|nr:fibrobacter succinogenes major paralogous domain-containing protein [Bacteroidales bacterium]